MLNRSIMLLFAVLVLGLILSSCSTERPTAENNMQELDNRTTAEVSGNPTPCLQTAEAVRVFEYPSGHERESSEEKYRVSYETIELKHVGAKKASEIMSRIAPEAVFTEGSVSNQMIMKGHPEDISRLKKIVISMDMPLRQIMIESRVVEISENELESLGVSWAETAGGMTLAIDRGTIDPETVYAEISALIANGKARLIASPSILTLDNHEAVVNIGSKIPFAVPVNSSSSSVQWSVQYIDAGVSLKITPRLGDKGFITVAVNPEVSSVSEWRMTSAGEFPVISTRNADTMLKIKDGQTIVIGGLINETDRENISKIPLAGDIPIVSQLFTKRTSEKAKTNVVFLITPRII